MKHSSSLLAPVVFGALVVACGGGVESSPVPGGPATSPPVGTAAPDPGPQPGGPTSVDHGAPSDKYPAFTPDIAQLVNNGGQVLAKPVITTVTWSNEPAADTFEKFGDQLGASEYWKAVTAEYGVGAATSGAEHHVRIPTAGPASISDADLTTFVQTSLSDAASGWPAPTPDSVYILYLPKGTSLVLQGQDACKQGVGGYHESVTVNGKEVAYAIVPQCASSKLDVTTLSASHELAEAATDPYPNKSPAWVGFDDAHLSWELFNQFQSENGDACEFYRTSTLTGGTSDFPFTVQRQWSNASAKAGHDPCVPAAAGPYYNVTPLGTETITADFSALGGPKKVTSKGYVVALGETRTIPIGLYSDAPMAAWTIKAIEGGVSGPPSTPRLELALDVASGQNGQKAYLTVKALQQGKTKTELVTIVSTANNVPHYMPILIGTP